MKISPTNLVLLVVTSGQDSQTHGVSQIWTKSQNVPIFCPSFTYCSAHPSRAAKRSSNPSLVHGQGGHCADTALPITVKVMMMIAMTTMLITMTMMPMMTMLEPTWYIASLPVQVHQNSIPCQAFLLPYIT